MKAWTCSIRARVARVTFIAARAIRARSRPIAFLRYSRIHADSSGSARTAGLSRYESATRDFVNVDLRAGDAARAVRVRAIRGDRAGALWIGTLDRGLIRFEPQSGRITRFQHDACRGRLAESTIACSRFSRTTRSDCGSRRRMA